MLNHFPTFQKGASQKKKLEEPILTSGGWFSTWGPTSKTENPWLAGKSPYVWIILQETSMGMGVFHGIVPIAT
jgi:hypothetical protein